jgi:hypothetical protein
MLRLGDGAAILAPAPLGSILTFGEGPRRLLRRLAVRLRLVHLLADGTLEPGVLGQAQHVEHAVCLGPIHQVFPAEAAVP